MKREIFRCCRKAHTVVYSNREPDLPHIYRIVYLVRHTHSTRRVFQENEAFRIDRCVKLHTCMGVCSSFAPFITVTTSERVLSVLDSEIRLIYTAVLSQRWLRIYLRILLTRG